MVVVLLVACVNVTTLILSRAAARRREFALRVALGASRWRLARVTLLESAWLGAAGLGAGLAPRGAGGERCCGRCAPSALPRLSGVDLNWTVAGWAALGDGRLRRRWRAGAARVVEAAAASRCRERDRRRPARTWGRRALIVSQVAGAFALLVAAGLLARSFSRVLAVDPGFDPRNLATVRVFLTPPAYRTLDQQIDYVTARLDALRTTPGVVGRRGREPAAVRRRRGRARRCPPRSKAEAMRPAAIRSSRTARRARRTFAPSVSRARRPRVHGRRPARRAARRRRESDDGATSLAGRAVRSAAGSSSPMAATPAGSPSSASSSDVATDGLETTEPPAAYAPYVQRTLPFLRWMTLVVTDGRRRGRLRFRPSASRLQAVDTAPAALRRSRRWTRRSPGPWRSADSR